MGVEQKELEEVAKNILKEECVLMQKDSFNTNIHLLDHSFSQNRKSKQ